MARVLVGLSGGADSAMAAYLLKKEGHEVAGLFLVLHEGSQPSFEAARKVAEKLAIPLVTLDVSGVFTNQVIRPTVEGYLSGETPSPCIVCNSTIKFTKLVEEAERLGFEEVATGHYARIVRRSGGNLVGMHKGGNDQSYFLAALTSQVRRRLRFPLSCVSRPAVRKMAEELGLLDDRYVSSQELCFASSGYRELIQKLAPERDCKPGRVVDEDGRVLGSHSGIHLFTVGQRRGLGLSVGKPIYVISIDPGTGDVVVGPRDALNFKQVMLRQFRWHVPAPPPEQATLMAKIRAKQRPVTCRVVEAGEGRVVLSAVGGEVFWAPAPGQAGVVYDEEGVLIGYGWIARSGSASSA